MGSLNIGGLTPLTIRKTYRTYRADGGQAAEKPVVPCRTSRAGGWRTAEKSAIEGEHRRPTGLLLPFLISRNMVCA